MPAPLHTGLTECAQKKPAENMDQKHVFLRAIKEEKYVRSKKQRKHVLFVRKNRGEELGFQCSQEKMNIVFISRK